MTQSVELTLIL